MFAQINKAAQFAIQALMPSRGMVSDPSYRGPDADFWYSSVMGLPNLAGVVGGENSWMFVSTSVAAMRILCGVGADMPLERKRVVKANGKSTTNVMEDDQSHRLMNFKPNPVMVSQSFKSKMIAWQIGLGTGFAEIVREIDTEEPAALWPIHPSRMTPFYSEDDGSLWWRVRNNDADPSDIPDTDMLRIPYTLMDDDNIHGLGIGKLAARSIGLGQTLERTEQEASSSSLPRIVVEHPKRMAMPEQDAFRRQWAELFTQGSQNVPALLVDGAKATKLDWSATDTDHRARREFNKSDLASWFGVSPALLDGTEDLCLLFQKISLHYLAIWEQVCNDKLLTQRDRDEGQVWQNDYNSLLKTDPVARSTYYTNRFSVGSLTPNRIKELEGENPSNTDGADVEYIQGAMRRLSDPYKPGAENPQGNPKDGKAPPLAPKSGKSAKAIRAARKAVSLMLAETLSRMTVKEMKRAKVDAGQPNTFATKVEEFYAEHKTHLSSALASICEAASVSGWKLSADRIAAKWCDASLTALIESSGVTLDKLSPSVELCVSEWNSTRVEEFVSSLQPKKRAVPC